MIALHSWITSDGDEHARVLDDCRRRMTQAVELGSPYIVASPPQEVVDVNRASDRFAELLEIGERARRASLDGVPGLRRRRQERGDRLGDRRREPAIPSGRRSWPTSST